jgi:hypothetical protein
MEAINEKTVGKIKKINRKDQFYLIVDYSKSLEQMIEEGKYNLVMKDIDSSNFFSPIQLSGRKMRILVKLFSFDRNFSTKEIISEMIRQQYRVAIFPELLALGKQFPNWQKSNPIVALGSIWKNYFAGHCCPYLTSNKEGREVNLTTFRKKFWDSQIYFMGVFDPGFTE